VASQIFQLLAVSLGILFAAKMTVIHRRCGQSDESWVGRFGQIWLNPDIKYKYVVIFLYFWLVFFPSFPSHIRQSKNHSKSLH
jgi:hypothetical protein